MNLESLIVEQVVRAIKALYQQDVDPAKVGIQKTRKEFSGDYTVTTFTLTSLSKKSPEATAEELGTFLFQRMSEFESFNVIKGFLNLCLSPAFWNDFFLSEYTNNTYGLMPMQDADPILVEFSSPNTNKPLHLGHIRNNLLGDSLSRILQANGKPVVRVNLVNDRGVHICKSMLAWKKWGEGERPEDSGMKGDHLVGKYYVLFDQKYREEVSNLISGGMTEEEAVRSAPLMKEIQEMLRQWEMGEESVRTLWKKMNAWVYKGFDATYARMGISFDKIYYESETYLLGKDLIEEGLLSGVFYKKEDGSVWCDLKDAGLDEKLLQRADGTSVYITQDLGTAQLRYHDYRPQRFIYVVGNEQNYHFEVLKHLLMKLGKDWASSLFHFSYGMVELPFGKMKSREGTVVDADDLMEEMVEVARTTTETLGKTGVFSPEESLVLYQMLALGALKYFILKVDPKKNMLFNPEESIDFNGNTGPFIQYTHARIRSLLRKGIDQSFEYEGNGEVWSFEPEDSELRLLRTLYQFPETVREAGENLSPAVLANYLYELSKEYNFFYQSTPVLKAEGDDLVRFRLQLSDFAGRVIKTGMSLLGIEVPDRM